MFNLFKRKKQSGLIQYSEAELDVLERFIADTFGPCDRVLHEVVSEDIHTCLCPGTRHIIRECQG